MRRLAQAVLRHLEIDGVYLTAAEAKALCSLIRTVWQLGGLKPGQRLSPYEQEVWERFAKRVGELP